MASKLSYAKFTDLLKTHDYITSAVYYVEFDKKHEKHAIFFECRLPKTQKNILVYVPPRYSMIIPKHVNPKLIELVKAPDIEGGDITGSLTEKSVNYLLNLRGPLINADIAVISVDGICHSKFNGKTVCYFLKENMPSEESEDIAEDEAENADIREAKEINEIEKDLIKAATKLKIPKASLPEKTKIEEPTVKQEEPVINNITNNDPLQPKTVEPPVGEIPQQTVQTSVQTPVQTPVIPQPVDKPDDGVELVFEDGDIATPNKKPNSDSSSSSDSSSDSSSSSSDSSSSDSHEKSKKSKKNTALKLSHRSNYIDVEALDVQMGIVYVVIDVDVIHKKFDTYEIEALNIYEQIDDNERDIQEERVKTIKKQTELVLKHLDSRLQKIQTAERGKKYYLLKLTGLLQDAENIKQKAEKKPNEKADIANSGMLDLDRVYNKTRKTIHELNISLLHQKDEVEDILVNYEESIKELFNL